MNWISKLGYRIEAFKNPFGGNFARLNDGTLGYNYETPLVDRVLSSVNIKTAYYTPVENLRYYYFNTFFLADCIDIYANICSQVKIMEVDKKGNEIENSAFVEFLQSPNQYQSLQEFIYEMVVNLLTTGISIQWGNFFEKGNMGLSNQLFNIDFNRMSMPLIKNPYTVTSKELANLIVKENLGERETRPLKMSELAYFYDSVQKKGFSKESYNAKNYFNPTSRIFPLLSSLHTLMNSQDSMCFLSNNPPTSILSPENASDPKNGQWRPLDDDQKRDAEVKLSGRGAYGAGSGKIGNVVLVSEKLKHLDLSKDNKKAQNIEMQNNAKENVRTRFDIPKDQFQDSTYENQQVSKAYFILGPVAAITDKFLNRIMNKIPGYLSTGNKLVGRYDHLPAVIAGRNAEMNSNNKLRAESTALMINAYERYKSVVDPGTSWDDFLIKHQFNSTYKA